MMPATRCNGQLLVNRGSIPRRDLHQQLAFGAKLIVDLTLPPGRLAHQWRVQSDITREANTPWPGTFFRGSTRPEVATALVRCCQEPHQRVSASSALNPDVSNRCIASIGRVSGAMLLAIMPPICWNIDSSSSNGLTRCRRS